MDDRPSVELSLEEMAVVLALVDELLSGRQLSEEITELARATYTMLHERSRAATT